MKISYTWSAPVAIYAWATRKRLPRVMPSWPHPPACFSVVKDSDRKKGESLLASTPVVVLSAIFDRIPTIAEYKVATKGIKLTQFSPPSNA